MKLITHASSPGLLRSALERRFLNLMPCSSSQPFIPIRPSVDIFRCLSDAGIASINYNLVLCPLIEEAMSDCSPLASRQLSRSEPFTTQIPRHGNSCNTCPTRYYAGAISGLFLNMLVLLIVCSDPDQLPNRADGCRNYRTARARSDQPITYVTNTRHGMPRMFVEQLQLMMRHAFDSKVS